MSGLLTNGMNTGTLYTGRERTAYDTQGTNGSFPQVEAISIQREAMLAKYYGATLDKTTVNGTRYYVDFTIGVDATLTGIEVLVGSTGGTDSWIAELHDSTGALVATSTTSGTTAGTANQWQRLAFTSTYNAAAGVYYIAIQSNGTTAKLATYNAPATVLVTGSAAGTFGTGASITPPTTYTANLGPMAKVY